MQLEPTWVDLWEDRPLGAVLAMRYFRSWAEEKRLRVDIRGYLEEALKLPKGQLLRVR